MSGDTFLLLLRLGFSLALVFGLMWVAGRVMKGRAPLAGKRTTDHVEVLERKALSRTSSIAVVRVGEQVLALGVSDTNVTVLSEMPLADIAVAATATAMSTSTDLTPALNAGSTFDTTATPGPVVVSSPSAPSPTPTSRQGWLDTLRDKTVRHIPS